MSNGSMNSDNDILVKNPLKIITHTNIMIKNNITIQNKIIINHLLSLYSFILGYNSSFFRFIML